MLQKKKLVSISNNFKIYDQCTTATKKVNMFPLNFKEFLSQITRSYGNTLYTIYETTPKYVIKFWLSNFIEDQNLQERVQKRTTKNILSLCNLLYKE